MTDADPDERCAAAIPDNSDADIEYTLDDKILFFKERECLLLLLESRRLLASMIAIKQKQTAILIEQKAAADFASKQKTGKMTVQEIQDILQSQLGDDDYDMVSEIQELKKNLIVAVRTNHKLERDLAKLDKRIALLIKNKQSLQEVLAASKGMRKKGKIEEHQMDPKKMEHYQDMFYLLQTDPKYLARCIYLISPQQLESFLDTVILTLFGDAYSPREEFLQLSLFQLAMQKEMSVIKNLTDFIGGQSETVLPKMINTYNKQKQGAQYLKSILYKPLTDFVAIHENLELNPLLVYQTMINEQEIKTGIKSDLPRSIPAETAAENPEVSATLARRFKTFESLCQSFVDVIIGSLDQLPYGLRWLCKQIRDLCLQQFATTNEDDISKVIIYFVYYRFINAAIVSPDNFHILEDEDLSPVTMKNLVTVSRVLQQMFNSRQFDPEKPGEKFLTPLNPFIARNEPTIKYYIKSISQVDDPEDHLQVNKYMELAQRTKPVIIISLHEIFRTHSLLYENLSELAPESDDPLRIIMNDLGPCEGQSSEEDRDDREIQLTLTNRFKVDMEEEAEHTRIYAETKELVIPILRLVPVQSSIHRLNLMDVLESGIKHATETKNKTLQTQINKILENLGRLENAEMVSKEDDYESFVHDVALEVANRSTIREQQRKEVARLKATLDNLLTHQRFVDESITSYQDYLKACKERQYMVLATKKRKPMFGKSKKPVNEGYKLAPIKFKYKTLVKTGVIIDSEVPAISHKRTTFVISSDQAGVFDVVAKIGGLKVAEANLVLDDMLEMHYNNINRLELDNVTLDVNMTIHLINKNFLS